MEFSTDYLEKLMHTETPKNIGGFTVLENHEIYQDYCELRNSAKDLLIDINDGEAKEKLSKLVIKLGLNN